jgi:hypothetical protein
MDLCIPHPDDANFPRILRGDAEMAEELERFREWPDALPQALMLASGYLVGSATSKGMGAAVLVALMTLYPETDFST